MTSDEALNTSEHIQERPTSPKGEVGRFRVLVLRSGALGDFILSLPVLIELRRRLPDAEIVYGGRSEFAALARSSGLVDRIVSDDSPAFTSLFVEAGHSLGSGKHPLSDVDLAVSLLGSDEVRSNLSNLGVPEVLCVTPLPPLNRETHAADHFLTALTPRWDVQLPALPKLNIPQESRDRAREDLESRGLVPGKFLAIQPGSGSRGKNWEAQRFAEVAGKIRLEAGFDLAVVSGPAEQDDGTLRKSLERCAVGWFESPRLSLLSAILCEAALYIGNDSGVTHLAAACGARTVAVFGPTSPKVWAPRGDNVRVVENASGLLEDVTVDEVLEAALRLSRE